MANKPSKFLTTVLLNSCRLSHCNTWVEVIIKYFLEEKLCEKLTKTENPTTKGKRQNGKAEKS